MNSEERAQILRLLDRERQSVVYPGVTRLPVGRGFLDAWSEPNHREVVFFSSEEAEVDEGIRQMITAARSANATLEWKWYDHDRPPHLAQRLLAAGFEAGELEEFMVLKAEAQTLARFGKGNAEIRRVTSREGLRDVQLIGEEVAGESYTARIEQYAASLENHPDSMSLYVAYIEGEPAACGRTYFHPDSQFAGLYGGQTRERFRQRGLYTQLVATRIEEAIRRGILYVSIDALPTSEPILRKRGFEVVTHTRPYVFPLGMAA